MSATYKNHKLLVNVQEFDKDGSKYLINGIDLEKAIFFWRESQRMYVPIPKGSYNISQESNNTYLNITDDQIIADMERLQICYEFASMSSTYEVDFNVDTNILKDRYNELVTDVKSLFGYVKSNMMVADGQDVLCVLPELSKDEVWVKTEDGWRGLNIANLEENIGKLLKEIDDLRNNIFREMLERKNQYIAEIDGKFESEVLEGIGRITATSEEKNQSLIDLSIQKEASLTELASQKNSMLEQTFNEKNEALIQTGDSKKEELLATFTQKNQELVATGEQKKSEIVVVGAEQIGLVTAEGDKQVKRVKDQGDIEVQRIIDAGVNGKLDRGGYVGTAQTLKNDIDGKVNKNGDTMTGELIIKQNGYSSLRLQNSSIDKDREFILQNRQNNPFMIGHNIATDKYSYLNMRLPDEGTFDLYHSGFKPTPADIGAVNKAGDTMTGLLTVENDIKATGGQIAVQSQNAGIRMATGSDLTGYLQAGKEDGSNLNMAITGLGARALDSFKIATNGEGIAKINNGVIYTSTNKPTPADINAVAKTGDTMNGSYQINPGDNGAYTEGLRINKTPGGNSMLLLGGTNGSATELQDGAFAFGVTKLNKYSLDIHMNNGKDGKIIGAIREKYIQMNGIALLNAETKVLFNGVVTQTNQIINLTETWQNFQFIIVTCNVGDPTTYGSTTFVVGNDELWTKMGGRSPYHCMGGVIYQRRDWQAVEWVMWTCNNATQFQTMQHPNSGWQDNQITRIIGIGRIGGF